MTAATTRMARHAISHARSETCTPSGCCDSASRSTADCLRAARACLRRRFVEAVPTDLSDLPVAFEDLFVVLAERLLQLTARQLAAVLASKEPLHLRHPLAQPFERADDDVVHPILLQDSVGVGRARVDAPHVV